MTNSSAEQTAETPAAPEITLLDEKVISDWGDKAQELITTHVLTVDTAIQCAVVLAAFIVAAVLARLSKPVLVKTIEGLRLPGPLRGALHKIRRMMAPILTLLLLFVAEWVHHAAELSVHFYFVHAMTRLVAASLIIRFAVSIIHNRAVQHITAVIVWIIAALSIFGILDDVSAALDSIALTMGDFRLSALTVVKCIIVTMLLVYGALGLSGLVERQLGKIPAMSSGSRLLITKLVRLLLVVLAILIGVSMAGINLSVLAVFSGAVGLGIGFGLQRGVSNLFTGMMLLLDRSVQPGDMIEMDNGAFGVVTHMGSRCTEVAAPNGKSYLIPNEELVTKPVINWSRNGTDITLTVTFGVDYAHNPHEIIQIALKAATSVERVLKDPAPGCLFKAFGESSLDFTLFFRIADPQNGVAGVQSEVLLALWDAFEANKIKIPYPRRDISILNKE
jgi:small-conductance mechanosensitive channel